MYCETCNRYLKQMTKKMMFYHKLYHTQDCFTCDVCSLSFYSEALLNFHIVKTHWDLFQLKEEKLGYEDSAEAKNPKTY